MEFVGLTISAAGDGTYNLSVEITHGTGKGSYFIHLWSLNDNTEMREAYGTVFTNLPGGEEYVVVVTWENQGKILKIIHTQVIIPHTSKGGLKFERLTISPDKRKDGTYDLYVKNSASANKGTFSVTLLKPDKTSTTEPLRNFEIHFPGLSGGEWYDVQIKWKQRTWYGTMKTKATIKTTVIILP